MEYYLNTENKISASKEGYYFSTPEGAFSVKIGQYCSKIRISGKDAIICKDMPLDLAKKLIDMRILTEKSGTLSVFKDFKESIKFQNIIFSVLVILIICCYAKFAQFEYNLILGIALSLPFYICAFYIHEWGHWSVLRLYKLPGNVNINLILFQSNCDTSHSLLLNNLGRFHVYIGGVSAVALVCLIPVLVTEYDGTIMNLLFIHIVTNLLCYSETDGKKISKLLNINHLLFNTIIISPFIFILFAYIFKPGFIKYLTLQTISLLLVIYATRYLFLSLKSRHGGSK